LREYPGAVALDRELLQGRRELLARSTPLGPEVDDDRRMHRPFEHLGLERGLGHIDDRHASPGGGGGRRRGRRLHGGRRGWGRTQRAEVDRAAREDRRSGTGITAHGYLVWHGLRAQNRAGSR